MFHGGVNTLPDDYLGDMTQDFINHTGSPEFSIIRYQKEAAAVWDDFVLRAKNGHFQFFRKYMEYHQDRFPDESLMMYRKQKLVALLPGHRDNDVYRSHGGLSFGGFILDPAFSLNWILPVFETLAEWLKQQGYNRLIYKTVPALYHRQPAEEDRWALYRLDAKWHYRNTSLTIDQRQDHFWRTNRKRALSKSVSSGLNWQEDRDPGRFYPILAEKLDTKYRRSPVHRSDELQYLMETFPRHIRLHVACCQQEVVAGVLVYNFQGVAHAQYIAATEVGEQVEALTGLFNHLIKDVYAGCRYFDFGICNEEQGKVLNSGLARFKEGFGAGTTVFEAYELEL
ncbi:MAG: GNAT family N-acetyltransferase [Saprospiraceae bacterium]